MTFKEIWRKALLTGPRFDIFFRLEMCHGKCWNWRCDPGQEHGKMWGYYAYGQKKEKTSLYNLTAITMPWHAYAVYAVYVHVLVICVFCLGGIAIWRLSSNGWAWCQGPFDPWNGGRIDLSTNMYGLGTSVSRFEFKVYIVYMRLDQRRFATKYQGFLQLLKCMCASLSSATRCHEIPMPRSSSNDEGLWWQHRDMDSVLQCCLFAKFWKVLSWRCWETPGVAGAHASKTSRTGEKICKATPAFLVHC